MHHLCSPLQPPLLPFRTSSSLYTTHHRFFFYTSCHVFRRRNVHQWLVSAAEREPAFEVDQDKARQALNELDQQLETLSMKQINSPKIKATSLSSMKEEMREEAPEMSGSYLGFLAFALFAFSIFYNIIFLTVIKPSIDGPDEIVEYNYVTTSEASSESQP